MSKLKVQVKEDDYKIIISNKGGLVFDLIHQYNPSAIILDINLRDVDGWKVLNRLKNDLNTRSIPIILISVNEEDVNIAYRQGAYSVITESVDGESIRQVMKKIKDFHNKKDRQLLLIEDSKEVLNQMAEMLGENDVKITQAASGNEALKLAKENKFDCIVLDLKLPDITGFELINQLDSIENQRETPFIVYSTQDVPKEELSDLKKVTQGIITRNEHSLEKLLDLTSFYLHRDYRVLPEEKQSIIKNIHPSTNMLVGKKALIVDDDVRNIFALVSALEAYGLELITAESGKKALKILEIIDDVDIILMDIMMPEMDGFETIQHIRRNPRNENVPIIAVTAKAMKGDRERCLEAGASDYITKPVDMGQLVSMIRIWMNEY